jgi:hypothetical protein
MSSEQEFDEGFQEDVAPDDGSAHEEAVADDQATDADFTDEEWSESDETAEGGEGGEGQPDQKGARKKKMNLMLLGGAVVIGLGVAYMTMHKKSVPIPLPTNTPLPKAEPTQTDLIYADAGRGEDKPGEKKKKVEGGFLTDPNLIKKAQKLSDGHVPSQEELMPEATHPVDTVHANKPPQPTPIKSPDVDADDNQPLTPMPQEVAGNMVKSGTSPAAPEKQGTQAEATHVATPATPATPTPPAPMPATNTSSTPVTPVAAQTPSTPKTGESPFAPPTTPTTAAVPAPAKLPSASETMGASSAQLDSITNKLDGIESQLKTLEGSVVHRDELADIHAQINALSQKVDALSTSGAAPMKSSATPATATHGHSHHAATHKSATAGTIKAHAQTWMLKSAMPGMAIVAGSNGQIMAVKPGDHVAGLGRIRSISEKNGRWVVTGTTGGLRQ